MGVLLSLALLLAAPLGAQQSTWSEADLRFFHEEIYEPFFTERRAPDGTVLVAVSRSRALSKSFVKAKAPGSFRVFVLGGSVGLRYMDVDGQDSLARSWSERLPGLRA